MTVKNYYLPESLDEAVNLRADHGPALLVMAGGTLVMPLINAGSSAPEFVMGLRRARLTYLRQTQGSLTIGATTTLARLLETEVPLLREAAHHVGGWAIRNLATVGGNLFAPSPSGDFGVALLALEAKLKLVGPHGERSLPLSEFYATSTGQALQADELLAEVEAPLPTGQTVFVKYGRKHANTPAIVSLAAQLELDGRRVKKARLAFGAVGPYPKRAANAEAALTGSLLDTQAIQETAEAAAAECEPIDDAIATAWYRRKMVKVHLTRALSQFLT